MIAWLPVGTVWLLVLVTFATLRLAIPELLIRAIELTSALLVLILMWREYVDGIEWNDDAFHFLLAGICVQIFAASLIRQKTARDNVGNTAGTADVPN